MKVQMNSTQMLGTMNAPERAQGAVKANDSTPRDEVSLSGDRMLQKPRPYSPPGPTMRIIGKLAGAVLKGASVIAGVALGVALGPPTGAALGAYGGITGDGLYTKPFNDPAIPGAKVHCRIEEKTDSHVLASAGGFVAGVPGGVLSATIELPVILGLMGYALADKLEEKLTGER